jgi:hypothetical protein
MEARWGVLDGTLDRIDEVRTRIRQGPPRID